MPNEQKLQALAERLLNATEQKSVQWTPSSPDRFQLSLPNGVVTVEKAGGYPRINVYDDNGNFVEALAETKNTEPWDDVLRDLWDAARNSALNIDQVLDSILKDVESAGKDPADNDIPF